MNDQHPDVLRRGNPFWWWLSFADDDGFLGGCIVAGETLRLAIEEAWRLGINPGGEVRTRPLNEQTLTELHPYVPNRLYSKAEMDGMGETVKF